MRWAGGDADAARRGGRTGGGRRVPGAGVPTGGGSRVRCGGRMGTCPVPTRRTSHDRMRDPGRTLTGTATGAGLLPEPLGAPTLEAACEAVLLLADQPLDLLTLASVVRRPVRRGRGGGPRAVRAVHRRRPRVRPARSGRRMAVLHPRRLRRRGHPVRRRRPAGPADAGGSGDAGDHRLPAADLARPDQRGARGERRRGRAHAHQPGPRHRGRRRAGQPGHAAGHHPLLPGAARASATSSALPPLADHVPTYQEIGDLVDLP